MTSNFVTEYGNAYFKVLSHLLLAIVLVFSVLTLWSVKKGTSTPLQDIVSAITKYEKDSHPKIILELLGVVKRALSVVKDHEVLTTKGLLFVIVLVYKFSVPIIIFSLFLGFYSYIVAIDAIVTILLSQVYWVYVFNDDYSIKFTSIIIIVFIIFDFATLSKYL